MGRPTSYTAAIGQEICERLAAGESLIGICRTEGLPSESTVRSWALDSKHEFSANYAHARELQAERFADELIEIADDSMGDRVETEKGSVVDNEAIQRSKLRVDTRKWVISKILPKKYGEKQTLEHEGEVTVRVTGINVDV